MATTTWAILVFWASTKKRRRVLSDQLGGSSHHDATIGKILGGPSFAREEMPEVIAKLINVYVENRTEEETFLDTYRRVGLDPFKERVYA